MVICKECFAVRLRRTFIDDAFMGIELVEGGLADFGGKFYESEIFENLSEEENETFTREFDAPIKR